jgi:hypothetical protein
MPTPYWARIRAPQQERNPMSFKFFVEQAVEYTLIGERKWRVFID